jgi:glycosyltransferase involved in cell wall biosynthesis
MNRTPAHISVIIPCYACAKTVPQVLDALLSQTLRPFEIIVVNDASPDKLDQTVQPYLDRIIYICHERNKGLARTCNDGLRAATGDFLMTVHADCILDHDYIEKLFRHMESDPSIGAATGQYLFDRFDELTLSDQLFTVLNRLPVEETRANNACERIAFIEGKADLFRRQPLEQLGFFNENLILTAEDQDLSVNLRRLGFAILQDNSCRFRVAFSGTSDSLKKILRKQRTYARGQAYVVLHYRKDAMLRTSANRNHRAMHRAMQLAFSTSLPILAAAGLIDPEFLAAALILLIIRGAMYYSYAGRLKGSARMLCVPMGIAADFCYLAGAVEGTIKTLLFKRT